MEDLFNMTTNIVWDFDVGTDIFNFLILSHIFFLTTGDQLHAPQHMNIPCRVAQPAFLRHMKFHSHYWARNLL
jgi:hypothetical protein